MSLNKKQLSHVWVIRKELGLLTRNSAAVAPVVANCTKRCTRRKVTVNAHSTNKNTEKLKKRCQCEKSKTTAKQSARGTSSTSWSLREGKRNEGRAEWLRIRREQSSHPNRVRIRVHSLPVTLLRLTPRSPIAQIAALVEKLL